MKNYKLKIQYDGTNYAGWQIQTNAVTIQQKIVEAVKIITGEDINLIGSGRTDSGVHALGQEANFKTGIDIDIPRFKHSLNSILARDISIIEIAEVPENFNARFDAVRRSYIYLFSKNKSPFFDRYSYFYHGNLNCGLLNELSNNFLGKKDFSSFAKSNSETKNKICTVYSVSWKETGGLIIFLIEADRFLHGMVRAIAGTLLEAVKLGAGQDYFEDIFSKKNRQAAGMAVPAKGLFLYKVKYNL